MKIYPLSQPQKYFGGFLLAIAAGVSVMLVLATRELESQMAVSDNAVITKEVKLQLSGNNVEISLLKNDK